MKRECVPTKGIVLILLFGVAPGCYKPQFEQGVLCAMPGRLCPEGQVCHVDDRCYDPDQIPPDAVLSSLDVSVGELVPPFDPQTTNYRV